MRRVSCILVRSEPYFGKVRFAEFVKYGTVRYDSKSQVVKYGTVQKSKLQSTVRYGTAKYGTVRYGQKYGSRTALLSGLDWNPQVVFW